MLVKVHIESFGASTDGSLTFQDIMPDDYDWDSLNRQETQSLIALGIQYTDKNEWYVKQDQFDNPVYAAEIDNAYAGALAKGANGTFKLCGLHGLAFGGNYSAKHDLIFEFSLF